MPTGIILGVVQTRARFSFGVNVDGLVFFHIAFGTTPNIAPPSSLNSPVLMMCKFIMDFSCIVCDN